MPASFDYARDNEELWLPAALDPALRRLTAVGVRSLVSQPPTLEELFLRHYAVAR